MQEELNKLNKEDIEDISFDIFRINQLLTPKLLQTTYNTIHKTKLMQDDFYNVHEVLKNYFSLEMMEQIPLNHTFKTDFSKLHILNSAAKIVYLFAVSSQIEL